MARAITRTWLPLDRWFEIIGVNPIFGNGMDSSTLFPTTRCDDAWQQFSWQHADQISREDLARVIRQAELRIAGEIGYNLIPDWSIDERHRTQRPADPSLFSSNALNIRGQRKSVEAKWGFVISGGRKASTLIQAGVTVTRSDEDGDSYNELMTVSVITSVTDPDDIRVYYPGESGNDAWEIRPIDVSISGGTATITFKSWQLVDPELQSAINAEAIDADANASYLTTVDVYRVYNDPQTQVQLLWEGEGPGVCASCSGTGCAQCTIDTQYGCLTVRDDRLAILAYAPATWDADDEEFDDVAYAVARDPERLRLWYYSGWQDKNLSRPRNEMDYYWEHVVAYYAASLLDRPLCGCSNITGLVKKLQRDHALSNDDGSFALTASQMDNNFGTTEGALIAFRATREPERRIGR